MHRKSIYPPCAKRVIIQFYLSTKKLNTYEQEIYLHRLWLHPRRSRTPREVPHVQRSRQQV